MAENTIKELKEFFGVEAKEMMDFWKSLSEAEKEEFKNADLTS